LPETGTWSSYYIIKAGRELRQRCIAEGVKLVFTRAAIGSGTPADPAAINTMTGLIAYEKDVIIKKSYALEENHLCIVRVDNTGYTQDVFMTEVGIFARGEDQADSEAILYGYAYNVDGYVLIPQQTSITNLKYLKSPWTPISAFPPISRSSMMAVPSLSATLIWTICRTLSTLPWQNKVNIVTPEIYDLPLINGFAATPSAKYWKTQENIVTITFRIGKGGVEIPAGVHQIGLLPEGFRPSVESRGTIISYPTVTIPGLSWISSDTGIINIQIGSNIAANAQASIAGQILCVAAY